MLLKNEEKKNVHHIMHFQSCHSFFMLGSVFGYSAKRDRLIYCSLFYFTFSFCAVLALHFGVIANLETGQKYKVMTYCKNHIHCESKNCIIAITVYCHSQLCHICSYILLWKSCPFTVALSSSVLIQISDFLKESVRWANCVSSCCKCCSFWLLKFMKIECCKILLLWGSSFWCRMYHCRQTDTQIG